MCHNSKGLPMSKRPTSRVNKLIDMQKVISDVLEGMEECRQKWEGNQSRITNRETQLAKSVIKRLQKPMNRPNKGHEAMSINTYKRYMTRVRMAIREAGYKHPALKKVIEKAVEEFPRYGKKFNAVLDMPNREARLALTEMYDDALSKAKSAKRSDSRERYTRLADVINDAKMNVDPAILRHLRADKAEVELAKEMEKERTNKYKDSAFDSVYNYRSTIELAAKLLGTNPNGEAYRPKDKKSAAKNANGWEALTLGVAMATGRRMYEIVYLSKFEKVAKRKLKITGLAKKQGAAVDESFTIDTLIDADAIIESVELLRGSNRVLDVAFRLDSTDSRSEKSRMFNDSVHKGLNECAGFFLPNCIEDQHDDNGKLINRKFKDSRDLYVNCLFEEYRLAGGTLKLNAFIEKNLSHDDDQTAKSYEKFKSHDVVTQGDVKRANRIVERQNDRLKKIKELAASKLITDSNPYTKAMAYIIEKMEENTNYQITTKSLREAYPVLNEDGTQAMTEGAKPKPKFQPVCSTRNIGSLVAILKDKELDFPA